MAANHSPQDCQIMKPPHLATCSIATSERVQRGSSVIASCEDRKVNQVKVFVPGGK